MIILSNNSSLYPLSTTVVTYDSRYWDEVAFTRFKKSMKVSLRKLVNRNN